MNVTPKIQKLIMTLLIVLALGYVAYSTIFTQEEVVLVEGELPVKAVIGQDLIILSEKLKNVNIDKNIFSSTLFTSLVDISVGVSAESQGRPNPFLPIGVDSSNSGGPVTSKRP